MFDMCSYAWDCVWEIHTLHLSRPERQRKRIKYVGAINTSGPEEVGQYHADNIIKYIFLIIV